MLEIALIRHGRTEGNLQKRYIGRTDEPLCEQGIRELAGRLGDYPEARLVFSSPLLRCKQTAALLYPGAAPLLLDGLRETDFGEFEGKNCQELAENPAYQAFVDSGGAAGFPGGEPTDAFKRRSCRAFSQVLRELDRRSADAAAVICHGGTIMAVMEAFCVPKQPFYSYQVQNGCGYQIRSAGGGLFEIHKKLG